VKVGLLTLIVLAAVVVIICGVWVTIALIADLWPRKTTACSTSQADADANKGNTERRR
jgi:hypothetical protein